MPKAEQVRIKPEVINLNTTMVRASLSAGVTSAKLGDIQTALIYLKDARQWIGRIESLIADNPARG